MKEICKRSKEPSGNVKICVYGAKPLFIFGHNNRFRRFIVNVSESSIFENVVLMAIVLSTMTMLLNDYSDRDDNETWN